MGMKEDSSKEDPPNEEPVKEEGLQEEPPRVEPNKEESVKKEPSKEEPSKEEALKEDPSKEEPKNEEAVPKEEPHEDGATAGTGLKGELAVKAEAANESTKEMSASEEAAVKEDMSPILEETVAPKGLCWRCA